MSNSLRIFVFGGHGRVALRFIESAIQAGHHIRTTIRDASQKPDFPAQCETVVESIEDHDESHFASVLREYKPNVVLFAAGAGGKGGPERTRKVDEEGAIKVFDALEKSGLGGLDSFRRLLLISAVDSRDVGNDATIPPWYKEKDIDHSKKMRDALGAYMVAKYNADKNLSQRTSFPWLVLRPSALKDDAGTGIVKLGLQETISIGVPRDDVASTLLALAELPKGQGDGLMLDLTGAGGEGEGAPIKEAVQAAAQRGRTDWTG
ncbi:unnamed protein product [Tilletia controversa]|uniref:NAD(P)-binding domain-containing protein n=3 Tax=Tilletia TaxID=13289 RepID=A0A8X7MP38_9BASI|nr:hypothetical protein CF336_g6154 [Tilletia laevis]KAE8191272.1 hypothetical protein CF328_g5726 [Tilletia controversa]KAE8264337.1 hypothetical protein A4X03_0g1029 [Tilletia caries]KAE8193924.1 hypothetical protein CF335_g5472 [Tilletia laevis]KAE8243135.1 hypothetical protein A4X06_0g6528 [Tilletia controversa]